jgi:hypothetical protein
LIEVQMNERKTIVVAVGQDALAMALWRALCVRRSDVDVHVARSEQAFAMLLGNARPAIVVLEIENASEHDVARLRRVQALDPAPRLVVIARERARRSEDLLFGHGADTIHPVPVEIPAVVDEIEDLLAAEDTMTGTLGHVGVLDLVQMLCLTRRSIAIRFSGPDGNGGLWLEDGEIVHAAWSGVVGMDALVHLSTLETGTFRCSTGSAPPRRTIAQGWRQALMSAACLADERRRDGEAPVATARIPSAPQPTAVVPVSAQAAQRGWQARYQELIELGLAAMRGGDLPAARAHWNEAKLLQESHEDDEAREAASRASRPTQRGFPASA